MEIILVQIGQVFPAAQDIFIDFHLDKFIHLDKLIHLEEYYIYVCVYNFICKVLQI